MPAKPQNLEESNLLIIWPKASASIGITLAAFIAERPRTPSASFTFISHPVPRSVLRETEYSLYSGTERPVRSVVRRENHIPLLSHLIDGLLTIWFLIRAHRRYDMCITAGVSHGLLGILLRSVRVVRKSSFIIMDYWPLKYRSSFLSRLYSRAHSWCSTNSDFVVDVAPTIEEARQRDGVRVAPERRIYAPHPLDPPATVTLPQEQLEADSLVWTGALTPECGFELVIDAIELVARERPGVTVSIATYERFPDELRAMIAEKGMEHHFHIVGYIKEEAEFNRFVQKHRIGLAPYRPGESSVKNFAGVARPWTYIANGVPPIITRVPPDAREIEVAKAGLVIDYDKQQLATAILELLTDDQLHRSCCQNGLELIRSRATTPVFTALLTKLGLPPVTHPEPAGMAERANDQCYLKKYI